MSITRREFIGAGAAAVGAGVLGAAALGSLPGRAHAFPPDSWIEGFARMIFHENPIGPSPRVFEVLEELSRRGRDEGGIMAYPDFEMEALRRGILAYNGVEGPLDPENVILGVGSTEPLMMIADAFTSPERATVTEWPTYRIFLRRAEQNGSELIKVPLRDPELKPDFEAIREVLRSREDVGLVHFNVINNPIGTFADRGEWNAFLGWVFENRPDVVVLADDSDPEFIEREARAAFPRVIDHVIRGENVIHVQTFSHAFGMTGLRLGYAMARTDLIERMATRKIFAGVSATAHAAGLASLADAEAQVERSYRCNHDGRLWLYDAFERMGLRYIRSHGAYVMVETGLDSIWVFLQMMRRKVLIRWGQEWDMDKWIRVNPGTEEQNERFIQALKDVLSRGEDPAGPLGLLNTSEGSRLEAASARLGLFPRRALIAGKRHTKILPAALKG